MSPGKRHQIGFAALPVLKLGEVVGDGSVRVCEGEGSAVDVASAGEHHMDHVSFDGDVWLSVSKQDAHSAFPQQKQWPEWFRYRTVFLTDNRSPPPQQEKMFPVRSRFQTCTDNHPQAKDNPQEACYRQRNGNRSYADQVSLRPIPLSTHIRGETRFGALKSQRPISRADTAPRLNAAMSQSLQKREDLTGQSQCRRSRTDARPANFHIRGETSRGVKS